MGTEVIPDTLTKLGEALDDFVAHDVHDVSGDVEVGCENVEHETELRGRTDQSSGFYFNTACHGPGRRDGPKAMGNYAVEATFVFGDLFDGLFDFYGIGGVPGGGTVSSTIKSDNTKTFFHEGLDKVAELGTTSFPTVDE